MDPLAKDVAIMLVPIVTIILGFIIGWLGQRSGFCSIGGIRDRPDSLKDTSDLSSPHSSST